jgi:hypothetical protein
MTQTPDYPPVRCSRYQAWRDRINELDQQFSEAMTNEEWSASQEARQVRMLQDALDTLPQPRSRYGFVDFSPANEPYRDEYLRGAELIDLLVQVTGIPKARKVLAGETFDRWWLALKDQASQEQGAVITSTPIGRTWNASAMLAPLERAAREYIGKVEEPTRDGTRRLISQARHPLIELSGDDAQVLNDLVSTAERLTGIPAT